MTLLVKHPVHVLEKTLKAKKYSHFSRYTNSYGCLEVGKSVNGKANRLDYYILLTSNKEMLRIPIARHYVYDMLLTSCLYRPISRQSKEEDKLWFNKNARTLNRERDFNQLAPDELHEIFENALGSLGDIIKDSPEKEQITARRHFDNLSGIEWKVDMTYKIFKATNFLEKQTD